MELTRLTQVVLTGCMLSSAAVSGCSNEVVQPAAEPVAEELIAETCATAKPDYSISVSGFRSGSDAILQMSPANYNTHPGCPNTWIASVSLRVPAFLYFSYRGPGITDDAWFPCDSMWTHVRVLSLSGAVLYDKTQHAVALGSDSSHPSSIYSRCDPGTTGFEGGPNQEIDEPNGGTYRLLMQAGFTNLYEPIMLEIGSL
jgi:hypothetical protein